MQNSLNGLYRCLLHGVLKVLPWLMADVLPALWERAIAMPWQVSEAFQISDQEIRAAFDLVTQRDRLSPDYCFCIFIDGLDEYQETTQWDHRDLVQLLCGWARASPQNVKLCVSSREHNVFMTAFAPEFRLRLHELTKHDMEAYVRDRLPPEHVPKHEAAKIAASVAEKAQGIFMWVALVIKAMRRQLDGGAGPETLSELLDSLPDELDSLYEHVLKSLSWVERRRAYRTFAIVETAKRYDMELSPFAYSFFEEYEADSDFASRESFPEVMTVSIQTQRAFLASKRLNNRCMGLVEVVRPESNSSCLDYTHRSVPEFLRSWQIQNEIAAELEDFSAVNAISQLFLAEFLLNDELERLCRRNFWPLLNMRHAHKLDLTPPYAYLERLDAGWTAKHPLWLDEKDNEFIVPRSKKASFIVASRPPAKRLCSIYNPLHVLMFVENHPYPLWKLSNDPVVTSSAFRVIILCYIALRSLVFLGSTDYTILDFLLERDLISATTLTSWMLVSLDLDPDVPVELTVWQHYLLSKFIWQFRDNKPKVGDVAGVIERFLRCGEADVYFTARLRRATKQQREREYAYIAEFEIGKERKKVSVLRSESQCAGWLSKEVLSDEQDEEPAVDDIPTEWVKSFDFQKWVEDVEVPNKSSLLQLVRKNAGFLNEEGSISGDVDDEKHVDPNPREKENSHQDGLKNLRLLRSTNSTIAERLWIIIFCKIPLRKQS